MNVLCSPRVRLGRTMILLGIGLVWTPAQAQIPSVDRPASRIAPPSEGKKRTAELQEADRLSQMALTTADNAYRVACWEGALPIYIRLGRAQQVIQVGLRYRAFLQESIRQVRESNETLRRLRELELQLGVCYLALGHYRTAETHLEAAVKGRSAPLSPAGRMAALSRLAQSAEKRGKRTRAEDFWHQVEQLALGQLSSPPSALSSPQWIECTLQLADCYRFLGKSDQAVARLTPLLSLYTRLEDRAGQRNTLRRLAAHQSALHAYPEAEKNLRRALDLHRSLRGADPILRGELALELAEVLVPQGSQEKTVEAQQWQKQAVQDLDMVLKPTAGEQPEASRVIAAFWGLQTLYQNLGHYDAALQLATDQEERWGGVLGGPRLKSQQGTLQAILSSFKTARALLREAVAELERQSPPNYVDLPRAYTNLAIVEQACGDLDQAEARANDCQALYRRFAWPQDSTVVETYNVLGVCKAQHGQYNKAVNQFRDGTDLCAALGRSADLQHSRLLLNLALLHKSQGDLVRALDSCRKAREVYQHIAEPDPLALAAFDAAQASLYAAQGRLDEAAALAQPILDLCAKNKVKSGPLVVTAHHCQGLQHLAHREFAAAQEAWGKAESLQVQEKNALLLPRTLNYLGLTMELQGELTQAEQRYRQARELQKEGPWAFPVTRFITLWRLACVIDRRGDRKQARQLLEEAVGLIEEARLKTYGDAQQRADFFGQFQGGLEQLIDWCVEDGDVEAGLRAAIRSRSRTLLDQLQVAGADPRAALQGPRGEQLRRQEEEAHQRVSGLRAQVQMISIEDIDKPEVKKKLDDLNQAQKHFEEVWREVLSASPIYRRLSAADPSDTVLPILRKRVLGPKTLLLTYHIGRGHSYLLLLGGHSTKPEVFSLTVAADQAEQLLTRPPAPGKEPLLTDNRGLKLRFRPHDVSVPAGPGRPQSAGGVLPLDHELAGALVEDYLMRIAAPESWPVRGLVIQPRSAEKDVPSQGLGLLGSVLLPPAVCRRIQELGPERLVVIPDGPLHKLPLEALLLETPSGPRYVLDELPPLIYAPSAAVLALLAERERPSAVGPLSLLTVSDPAYPPESTVVPAVEQLGPRRPLKPLPGTAQESQSIRQFFDPSVVKVLSAAEATEGAVRRELPGKRIIHLAAHGFADEAFGNLFGALALAPSSLKGPVKAEDDGFLYLHEIYTLPSLRDCELAVLSACVTNVGPQRPLEAGVTLAGGFLAAGARRVVASQWNVSDRSTAVLMEAFFAAVTDAVKRNQPVDYAAALQKARQKVRQMPERSAPFYWAPFVLIGPTD